MGSVLAIFCWTSISHSIPVEHLDGLGQRAAQTAQLELVGLHPPGRRGQQRLEPGQRGGQALRRERSDGDSHLRSDRAGPSTPGAEAQLHNRDSREATVRRADRQKQQQQQQLLPSYGPARGIGKGAVALVQ